MSKKNKEKKEMPIGLMLILILLFSFGFVGFGVLTGVMIGAIVEVVSGAINGTTLSYAIQIIPAALVYLFMIIMFIFDWVPWWKKEPGETFRSDVLLVATILLIIGAVAAIAVGQYRDNDIISLVGTLMLPGMGVAATPYVIIKTIKKLSMWDEEYKKEDSIYKKRTEDFYQIDGPLMFESKLYWKVFWNRFGGFIITIVIMVIVFALGLGLFSKERNYRSDGFTFFAFIFVTVFGLAIAGAHIAKSIYKLRVIRKHKYYAYHVIVDRMDVDMFQVYCNNGTFFFEEAICVGMNGNDVKNMGATLIIIPDGVLVYPDEV